MPLPQAIAALQANQQQQQPVGDPYATPYDDMLKQLQQRMLAEQQKSLYTPEQVAQRQQQNEQQYQLGALGMLSGNEGLQGVGGQVFKQALAERAPRITERGIADPLTGQFQYNPEYQQERLQQMEQTLEARRAQLLEARRAEQQQANLRRELLEARLAGQQGSTSQVGAFHPEGMTPEGANVVTNTKDGMRYTVTVGPNGQPSYAPYTGTVIPHGTVEKNVATTHDALASAQRADQLLKTVDENRDAFGIGSAAISQLPGYAQGYAAPLVGLTPEKMAKRAALLRQAAMETHELYGAAQSAGELARAATFMPLETDTPDIIMSKLKAGRDWAYDNARRQGPGVVNAAVARSGGQLTAPPVRTPGRLPQTQPQPSAAGGDGWSIKPKGTGATGDF